MRARDSLARWLLPLLIAASAKAQTMPGPGDHTRRLKHGGHERAYTLRLPPAYEERGLLPMVIVLSGGRLDLAGLRGLHAGRLDRLADEEGLIVLYPEPIENVWNDGRGVQTFYSQANRVDDVGFLSTLIRRVVRDHKGDRRRVYIAGFSNGGLMAQRAACELSGQVAAVASVAGGIAAKIVKRCRPPSPVSLLMIHGDKDNIYRWDGTDVTIAWATAGKKLTIAENARLWRKLDKCPSKPRTALLPDADPSDGTRIRSYRYGPCAGGAEVAVYRVGGGGHTWPGGGQWQPDFIAGAISRDADASDLIWDFFKERTLSE